MLRAYLITLEYAFRANESINELRKKIPDLEIYYGVDARAIELRQLGKHFAIEKFIDRYKRLPTPGEIGCTLSHLQCIERAFTDPAVTCCLVLEDDALIGATLNTFEKLEYAAIRNDLDIIVLGTTKNSANPFLNKSNPLIEVDEIDGVSLGYRYSNGVSGAVGYMMTRAAYTKIKQTELPYHLADDWVYYNKLHCLRVSFVEPPIVLENEALPSTLGHDLGPQKISHMKYKILWPIYQILWYSRSQYLRVKYRKCSKKIAFKK